MAAPLSADLTALRAVDFEGWADGRATRLYTLANGRGMSVSFTNLGAKIQQILVPDRDGVLDDVALGYPTITQVMSGQPSLGAFIGRYANRIADGRFTLDGVAHRLPANSAGHCLHGGARGSWARVFDVHQGDAATAEMELRFESADDGFPGGLHARVSYRVTADNELLIAYQASCDAPTIVSMTSHVFFNLAGQRRTSPTTLGDHTLLLNASAFTPVGPTQIPTGEIRPVAGTPMDFRIPCRIAERLEQDFDQFLPGRGYDHNWVVDKPDGALGLVARVAEPVSGRVMEVWSTEPGVVFYGGNNLSGQAPRDVGKGGLRYESRSGLCLELARFPDSPNHPNFPSAVLRPGERYTGETRYRFTTDGAVAPEPRTEAPGR